MTKGRGIQLFIAWAMVLIWMGIIYSLSAQPAAESGALSHGLTEWLVKWMDRVLPVVELSVNTMHHLIRKYAHFVAYLILAVLVSHAFSCQELKGKENLWSTFFICVLYATSDEIHQMMVPGRGPSPFDVLIDSAGAVTGILLYYFAHRLVKNIVLSKSI